MPPGRKSIFAATTLNSFGPHQCFMRSGSVNAFQREIARRVEGARDDERRLIRRRSEGVFVGHASSPLLRLGNYSLTHRRQMLCETFQSLD
jgi:hypothetical protein